MRVEGAVRVKSRGSHKNCRCEGVAEKLERGRRKAVQTVAENLEEGSPKSCGYCRRKERFR